MPLVRHDPEYRRIWMFPRNIRYIAPWKLAQIVALLSEQLRYDLWSGKQEVQDQFTKALELAGIKRPGIQYDPHSGGARTYLAQLECLGLLFKRGGGLAFLTVAGEDMANGEQPLPILQELLFRHQYPSVYSRNSNVKIHPAIKVQPFLFVLELMDKAEYLTNTELVVPMIYGHNSSCIAICLKKIAQLRAGVPLESLINSTEDLYTPRTRNRDVAAALADIRDIANTCKNYMQAACLTDVETVEGCQQMKISADYLANVQEAIESKKDNFIKGWETPESFQRKLGSWNRRKDTRDLSFRKQESPASSIIAAQFYRHAGEAPVTAYPLAFVQEMTEGYGFSRGIVEKTVEPLLSKALTYFESTYLDMAKSGGKKAIEFEKATGRLFSDKLKFSVEHTGQKKRIGHVGGYADLFLVAVDDQHCAIIDTKSTTAYNLNATDYRAMVNDYIPGFMELSPNGKPRELEFCAYIAGGFTGGIDTRLKNITEKTGVPVSAISASNFLTICKNDFPQEAVRSWFRSGRELLSNSFIEA
jgi:hypothetical protein